MLSQRSNWPVKASPRVSSSSTAPVSQFASLGNLYAPTRNACAMCSPTKMIIAVAP